MTEVPLRAPRGTLQVSQLTRYIKYLVEQDEFLTQLSVEGEISDLSRSMAGHVYFNLKDANSQISCVLFRREAAQQLEDVEQLRKGLAVVVHGFLTLYEPRGTYQVYVERVLVQGQGAAHLRFERLKAKLEAEGLFAPERKRPLPEHPRTMALVTSPGSQAYHDVLHRLRTQYPFVRVIEVGVSVQGDGAADEMAMALDIVNRLTDAEVILLVRGGGDPEDLVAFNHERLARAIYSSRIPIITGVGHETDYTIADFVADHRAATPSLAAAAAVPDVAALAERVYLLHQQSAHLVAQRVRHERGRWLEVNRALLRASPQNRLQVQRRRARELTRLAVRVMQTALQAKRGRKQSLDAQLRTLDPFAILRRGYAVVTDIESDRVISAIAQVQAGKRLQVRVADGEFVVHAEES
jgi:exodeoxyribonuclease VII large subunit